MRYSLRTLLIVMLVVAGGTGLWVRRAERQRRAVKAIDDALDGVSVVYDYARTRDAVDDGERFDENERSKIPACLLQFVGVDYFHRVTYVPLTAPGSVGASLPYLTDLPGLAEVVIYGDKYLVNADLAQLHGLHSIRRLEILSDELDGEGLRHVAKVGSLERLLISGSKLTDENIQTLSRISGLKILEVSGANVTDAGYVELQKALPLCRISRL
jgi:hypothetical protein